MEVDYRRGPHDRRLYPQELLHRGPRVRVTLHVQPHHADPLEVARDLSLEAGAPALWFTFPGRPYEVASFHDAGENHLGHYTNLIRPVDFRGDRWIIRDLWLDVWQPASGAPRILDRDDLARALQMEWISPREAQGVRKLAGRILERAEEGTWPPSAVRRTPLAAVPALRFRRDRPGTYFANLVIGRIVAYGIYVLGAVSLTTLAFVVLTGAPGGDSPARRWWLFALAVETVALFPFAITGRLPATRWPWPGEALSERTLAVAAVVTGAAVLFLYDSETWRVLLGAVCAVLAFFAAILTTCRAWFDGEITPWAALPLALTGATLLLLL